MHKPLALLLLGIGILACRGEAVAIQAASPFPDGASHANTNARPASDAGEKLETGDVPQDVLVGTDVEKLADHLTHQRPVTFPSTYAGEQGGATASVQLREVNGKAVLSRIFKEPGAKAQRAEYSGLSIEDGGKRLTGPAVQVLGVKDGILVLEKRSGVDGIPPSLWILYEQKRAKRSKVK